MCNEHRDNILFGSADGLLAGRVLAVRQANLAHGTAVLGSRFHLAGDLTNAFPYAQSIVDMSKRPINAYSIVSRHIAELADGLHKQLAEAVADPERVLTQDQANMIITLLDRIAQPSTSPGHKMQGGAKRKGSKPVLLASAPFPGLRFTYVARHERGFEVYLKHQLEEYDEKFGLDLTEPVEDFWNNGPPGWNLESRGGAGAFQGRACGDTCEGDTPP